MKLIITHIYIVLYMDIGVIIMINIVEMMIVDENMALNGVLQIGTQLAA